MFIDYVTLLLVNMLAGHVLLALFILRARDEQSRRHWVPALAAVGIVAFIPGLHMIFTWPLPGSYSSAYGEMSVLFGTVFLALAMGARTGSSLIPVGLYTVFAGVASIVLGIRFIGLGFTLSPWVSGIGFVATGSAGVLLPLALRVPNPALLRRLVAAILLVAAIIWAMTAYPALWSHMENFKDWTPSATLERSQK